MTHVQATGWNRHYWTINRKRRVSNAAIEDEESEEPGAHQQSVSQGASLIHKHPHWELHQMKGLPRSSRLDFQEEKRELTYSFSDYCLGPLCREKTANIWRRVRKFSQDLHPVLRPHPSDYRWHNWFFSNNSDILTALTGENLRARQQYSLSTQKQESPLGRGVFT